jgi:hypothetical protein
MLRGKTHTQATCRVLNSKPKGRLRPDFPKEKRVSEITREI